MNRFQRLGAVVFGLALGLAVSRSVAAEPPGWKVGAARAKITPEKPFWMAGFGARTRPAEGVLQDLWVKALALEDAQGHVGVVATADLVGYPKNIYDSICRELKRRCGLDRAQLMLTTSHTHSGPVLRDALQDIYPLDDTQRALIEEYSVRLEKLVVDTVAEAASRRTPATLWAGQGEARFAVNRRTNNERELPDMLAKGIAPKGPSDFAVPVLAVRTPDGKLHTVVCGYAAHTSAMTMQEYGYHYSGDYAGFALAELEGAAPEIQAMFFQGCGSDQSAAPRGTLQQCKKMAAELAASVRKALDGPMRPVAPQLKMAFEFVKLDFEQATREYLEKTAESSGYESRWAKRLLKALDQGRTLAVAYPEYPVQAWRLGENQWWIALGGEVAVDYALLLKKQYGPDTWVAGYTNDVMAYIPSRRVWEEGGYQAGAFPVYGLPAVRWCPDIQDRITAAVDRLVERLK